MVNLLISSRTTILQSWVLHWLLLLFKLKYIAFVLVLASFTTFFKLLIYFFSNSNIDSMLCFALIWRFVLCYYFFDFTLSTGLLFFLVITSVYKWIIHILDILFLTELSLWLFSILVDNGWFIFSAIFFLNLIILGFLWFAILLITTFEDVCFLNLILLIRFWFLYLNNSSLFTWLSFIWVHRLGQIELLLDWLFLILFNLQFFFFLSHQHTDFRNRLINSYSFIYHANFLFLFFLFTIQSGFMIFFIFSLLLN